MGKEKKIVSIIFLKIMMGYIYNIKVDMNILICITDNYPRMFFKLVS